MSWFVARLRDDVDRGLQAGALSHRLQWLTVELAASGEDAEALALFANVRPGGELGGDVYLTPGCAPFLVRLLADLEGRPCDPPSAEGLILLGGAAVWQRHARPAVPALRAS